ncbi:hypothetical protein SAMN04490195_2214 [Pseudomonas moorei]|uniref:Uncharacterized protein n=1 Tax=Pseudomonas moorei TaxID=395599 RepID=A0A1H1EIF7_9PSED|nr:hypothetical protein SAMN04490195_2214 [Pseudomonas moorei]
MWLLILMIGTFSWILGEAQTKHDSKVPPLKHLDMFKKP